MSEKVKNRIKIILNYEKYDPKLPDKITVLLIREGWRLACTDLINSTHTRTLYFSKRE
ncbi:hypothetical protein LCGC14_1899210 [marine sediment metagenome]|uniref:Uncharacterized protein n=1 Tax=marine sediment metagenome TaxID=412755 RepID=A0A0F9FXB6_9ZZZZ